MSGKKDLEDFIKSESFKKEITAIMVPYTQKVIETCIKRQSEETKEIVSDTMKMVFLEIGVNIANDKDELKKDFSHIRQAREGCEVIKRNIIRSILTVTIPTIMYFTGIAVIQNLKLLTK